MLKNWSKVQWKNENKCICTFLTAYVCVLKDKVLNKINLIEKKQFL